MQMIISMEVNVWSEFRLPQTHLKTKQNQTQKKGSRVALHQTSYHDTRASMLSSI